MVSVITASLTHKYTKWQMLMHLFQQQNPRSSMKNDFKIIAISLLWRHNRRKIAILWSAISANCKWCISYFRIVIYKLVIPVKHTKAHSSGNNPGADQCALMLVTMGMSLWPQITIFPRLLPGCSKSTLTSAEREIYILKPRFQHLLITMIPTISAISYSQGSLYAE